MPGQPRNLVDKLFTSLTYLSVVLLTGMLLFILAPMIWRGSGAVFFKGTVEFRKMQLELFERGDPQAIAAEQQKVAKYRDNVYRMLSEFKSGVDRTAITERVRNIYREYGRQLKFKNIEGEKYSQYRSEARQVRDMLEESLASFDRDVVQENLAAVLEFKDKEFFSDTVAEEFFEIALSYRNDIKDADLKKLEEYTVQLGELETLIDKLFGPRPGTEPPAMAMNRFGATRWDMAEQTLHRIKYVKKWHQVSPDKPMEMTLVPRKESFEGTVIADLITYIDENAHATLNPKPTVYWQYFIDDSMPGHYFGGIGPEIFGTLLLTVLGMLIAVPIGVTAAAYLVECAGDNLPVRIIRMCINTLAGVPSIVFGLFGLAFFVLYVFPVTGAPSTPCVLAAALTLSVLTLPVIIRASEEAIRSVPMTYREASLGLGAGKFTTFMKVTMPAAMPGILTGVILSLSRIAGETAPILFTGAVALGPIPGSIFEPTRTLSYGSWDMAVGDRLAQEVPHNQYGMVVTLILLILLLNMMSIYLRSRMFKRLRGQ